MSCTLEPAIWSRDAGQQIPCFDRCQLILTWMSNIKEVHGKPRLHVSVNLLFRVWPPCCVTPSSSCVRAHEQCPLAMVTMRKSAHGFSFLSYMSIGLRLAALTEIIIYFLELKCPEGTMGSKSGGKDLVRVWQTSISPGLRECLVS